MYRYVCQQCWGEFETKYPGTKYCSRKCVWLSQRKREESICPICGNAFYSRNNKNQIYCSKECYTKAQTTIWIKHCEVCWKEFKWKDNDSRFCSRDCYYKSLSDNPRHPKKIYIKNCLQCWKEFETDNKNRKYCSNKCSTESHRIPDNICPICWVHYHRTQPDQIYCSHECYSGRLKLRREKLPQEEKDRILEIFTANSGDVISKTNREYWEYLTSLWFEDISFEFPIQCKKYDLKVWEILIELNPTYTHNSTYGPKFKNSIWAPKVPDYHYNKLKLARDNWYRCVMVRDWDDLTKIPYLLEENKQQLYARKCEVKQITREECHDFFESYHLQGDTVKNKNNIYIWLYYNDELVECMSFWLPRYNKNYEREILRLCTHKDYRVVWWADKIFKHFLKLTNANSVISYCDMSKFDWKVYEQLGFKLLKWNKPSKHWYNEKEIESRKHITDNFLRQRWYDQIFSESYGKGTNNDELMKQRGYVEIYDCGQATFIWTKS